MAILTHKCPNCDAALQFVPDKQQFHCEYCSIDFTVEEMNKIEKTQAEASAAAGVDTHKAEVQRQEDIPAAKQKAAEKSTSDDAISAYSCPSCGAEIITDETTAATFCYYCHSPVVLQGRLEGAYHPNKIIPFQISREEAVKKFMAWVKSKKFVPNDFFSEDQIEKLTGVYFPFWDLDYVLEGNLSATGDKVNSWITGNTEFTNTKNYDISRNAEIVLADIVKNALKKVNKELVDAVQPFDQKELTDFTSAYLAGFMAERRDIELSELEGELTSEVNSYGKEMLNNAVSGYSNVRISDVSLKTKKRDENYLLLPVWTLTYKKKNDLDNKIYYYAMNGQTGKTNGELPIDKGKLLRLFLSIAVPVFLVVLILGYFL